MMDSVEKQFNEIFGVKRQLTLQEMIQQAWDALSKHTDEPQVLVLNPVDYERHGEELIKLGREHGFEVRQSIEMPLHQVVMIKAPTP